MTAPRYQPVPWPRIPPETWREQAACRDHPTLLPQAWDDSVTEDGAGGPESRRAKRVAAAIAVCKGCPVRDACLADVDLAYDEGVRGGVDLRELRAAQKRALALVPDDGIDHGTERGAKQHYRRGESACRRCAAAANQAKLARAAARSKQVACEQCHKLIRRPDISRHRRRIHGGES